MGSLGGRRTAGRTAVPIGEGVLQAANYFKLFDHHINLLVGPSRRWERSHLMDLTMLQFLASPFVASLILTGIHAYLRVHVVERGAIFVDLSPAQIAALGATIALLMPFPVVIRRRSTASALPSPS